jgi:hypothetical protein
MVLEMGVHDRFAPLSKKCVIITRSEERSNLRYEKMETVKMNTLAHLPLACTGHTWWRHGHARGSGRLKHVTGDVEHSCPYLLLKASSSRYSFFFHMHVINFIHNQMIKRINLVLSTYQNCNFFR